MARGDFHLFDEFVRDLGDEVHDFAADTFKLGICTSAVTPASSQTTPTWADFSAAQCSTAGNYTGDGETLTGTTFSITGNVAKFDAADVTISQSTAGFTDAYWGILYNASASTGFAIGYVDLAGPVSEQAGDITFQWNSSGIFTISINT